MNSSELLKNWKKTLEEVMEVIKYQKKNFEVSFGELGRLNNQLLGIKITRKEGA